MRSGDSNEWESDNPVLAEGELGVEVDTGLFKVGDGEDDWLALDYGGPRGIVVVEHGVLSTFPRPPAAKVYWQGQSQPLNANENDVWIDRFVPPAPMVGTGGTTQDITVDGVDYRVHTFTESDDFVVEQAGVVEYLIVAGGGGGGQAFSSTPRLAGGGGAGGLLAGFMFVPKTTIPVVVGAGGLGSTAIAAVGGNGDVSSFADFSVQGGGGGGSTSSGDGVNGGSGGGAATGGPSSSGGGSSGGVGIPGQGNAGADALIDIASGGGGGATAAGGNIAGGSGLNSTITGTPAVYAQGGDGAEGAGRVRGADATVFGGGGGGGKNGDPGGDGADGIVILRYRL